MNSIAPVWDGNETWLVLGGGGLMAAFPLAYAVILSALYAPIIAMLLALIFRGVAFEFRWRDPAHRRYWDVAFTLGSIVAALAQGITLGALLQGIAVKGRAYAGGWWDWLTPFSLLVGVSLVVRLRAAGRDLADHEDRGRTAGALPPAGAAARRRDDRRHGGGERRDAVSAGRLLAALVRLAAGAVHRAGAAAGRRRLGRLLPQPAAPASDSGRSCSRSPCSCSASSAWASPCIRTSCRAAITIWQAAAPDISLMFMLVGRAVLIPIILAYTALRLLGVPRQGRP